MQENPSKDGCSAMMFYLSIQAKWLVCRLASEEMENHTFREPIGRYTLLYDPIDGSSNTDINLSLGSIFAIRQQQGNDTDDQPATCCKMAVNNRCSGTSMVPAPCWFIPSAREFTRSLDPSLGEFILSDENIQIPNHGPIYSVNEGNFWQWMSQFGNTSV